MTILIPATGGNCSLEKKRPFLTKFVFVNEQLFHPVQCSACKIRQFSSKDKLFFLKATSILSISDQFQYL